MSGGDADIPGYVDRFLSVSHPRIRGMLHALFWLLEHATLVFPAPGPRGRRRYSSLSPDQRVAVLDSWEGSGLYLRRIAFFSLRSLCAMAYLAHPPVLRRLGLAPYAIDTPRCRADLLFPRIGAARHTVSFSAADVTAPVAIGVPLDRDGPLHPDWADDERTGRSANDE